ncbi:DUF899 family protein [Kineococcus gypseus]|uniref:DUF899 family protein n=1 Tax=Kineococcus gypseus TaxID=1637102 RepID=UPI003D7C6263
MPAVRLPLEPLTTTALPEVVDRDTWLAACEELLVREKAHTREGDAIAAARRRLPVTRVPDDARVVGPDGPVPFLDVFEGRRQLVVYFHMWHEGRPPEGQCEGCTFLTAEVQRPQHLHARDVTLAVVCEGGYEESRRYADFVGNRLPWYSAGGSDALVDGRGFGLLACYVRRGEEVYETWWTTGRGTEAMSWSFHLLDRTLYGRQEGWEDSPAGWPRDVDVRGGQFRTAGRPTVQWSVTDEPAAHGLDGHCAAC